LLSESKCCYVAISYIIYVYCEDYVGYFTVILSFLAFHLCSSYFIYLASCIARHAPLVLPQSMNYLPVGDYLKYMPKFTGEEDITTEEHLVSFYSYADNLNIENEDVCIRVFVQSLDGEARKWFRGLNPGSIDGIEDLDDVFLRQWGDKKDFMYYITEFGSLKRKEG
jgi:hypothetical protein